ncbi:MAG: class I SAM-dependent DNA methyltransferase [Cytophagales bacterium]|nr:class I SAM-dependent DNA methyltransferase [Cytophagales bacterium]MCA6382405.1 class I SAM-dependent DNA methyltransferase [Cytophagales bacterium]
MNIAQIDNNLRQLVKSFKNERFIYDLLLAYGQPKATIKRIKDGGLNLSKVEGEIVWKKKLFFKAVKGVDLHELFADITSDNKSIKHDPRFIVVTDYKNLLAVDTKTQDTLDIAITDIAKHFDFFLPWAGMEKAQHQNENPADVRAAEKMAKLYDDIKKDNPIKTQAEVHNLNVFLSRLLFCFFAEDTGILDKGQFTLGVGSHTQQDGSDLNTYLDKLFEVMNTEQTKRKNLPNYLTSFPYVNGGLFRNKHTAPKFTRKSRQSVIDSGELDWSAINPDIFGSMIQAVITPEHRGGLGMHYTSVPNIMKVIEPLFLNELYEEFEAAKGNNKKLNALLHRIWNIKIFDPACGSGNFLIIAYKELRKLEMKIFKAMGSLAFSNISLGNFYGIELDDFAHEVAILSLWLAEHQMNQVFFKEFGRTKPALPLTETGNIVHGNATRLDWEKVCPKEKGDEIYVLGNPPYMGARFQSKEQKDDVKFVFDGMKGENSIDYISCWFLKGAKYVNTIKSCAAFVSTNSITQGEQIALLWPEIFKNNVEISFAHQKFKWTNNAKGNAGVTCVIVGVQNPKHIKSKKIYVGNIVKNANNISPYLTDNANLFINKRSKPLRNVPALVYGNQAIEGGHLILSDIEKSEIVNNYPSTLKFFRRLFGADDFINDIKRWCIWIYEKDLKEAKSIKPIADRIKKVEEFRKTGGDVARSLVPIPYRFRYVHEAKKNLLIVPRTTSERRTYLPVGIKNADVIVTDSTQVVYDPELYIMGFLSSRIHMTWVKAVAGGLETRIGYSNSLCYNSYPFPSLSKDQKDIIDKAVYKVLEERENHSEKTLAQLYDPDKMPDGLREAHHQLDLAIERCYRSRPFETDEERLEYLFKLYEQMIEDEKSKGTLFEVEAKPKKKKK